MMNDISKEKRILRRYVDDLYTGDEASQLFDHLQEASGSEWLDEVAAELWEESTAYASSTHLEREQAKKEARQLLKRIEHKKRTWLQRISVAVAGVAAVVLMVWGGFHYIDNLNEQSVNFTEVATSFGEKKQLTLPDGTKLVLNSCSRVRYPHRFTGDTRQVELKGQGYFQVARNEAMPFVVHADKMKIRVLGTRFDIKSYATDELVSVSVESGKVQVDLPEAMMRLTAREQVVINTLSGEYSKRKEEREIAGWIKGSLRFNSTPIRDVASELERIYNCRITFAPGQEMKGLISGEHDNQSLESVLKSLEYVNGIKYKKEGRNILLYK
ncbi:MULTISPECIES: FecR family protein [Bacteroides]|uniref:FecR family protein n=2 Tax=Bacteroides TaxID=816 RepID=UPI0009DE3B05